LETIFERVCIAGAGPMGTSLGLALKRAGVAGRIVGWDREPARMQAALDRGAFDAITAFPQDVVGECDLLVAAVPTHEVTEVARRYGARLGEGAVFMDVCSIKAGVFEACVSLLSASATYVSVHPWVTLDGPGRADAFDGALCVVCPEPQVRGVDDHGRAALVAALWASLGCEVRAMAHDEHDLVRAAYVDLPRILAAAQLTTLTELAEAFSGLGHGGQEVFEAQTRVLGTGHGVAAELDANQAAVLAVLPRMISVLEDLKGWLETRSTDRVAALCEEASEGRAALLRRKEGADD